MTFIHSLLQQKNEADVLRQDAQKMYADEQLRQWWLAYYIRRPDYFLLYSVINYR